MAEITVKLAEVFKYLLQIDKQLPDDTCLQRLLDVIKVNVLDKELEASGLIKFLQDVTAKTNDIESTVLTFSLLLCGNLGENENLFIQNKDIINGLLQQVTDHNLTTDSSIGTAYFTCLSQIALHKMGVKYFFEKSVNTEFALTGLKHGESVFLQTAARNLIKTLLTHAHHEDKSESQINNLFNQLMTELQMVITRSSTSVNSNYTQSLLSLFNDVNTTEFFLKATTENNKTKLLNSYFSLSLTASDKVADMALDNLKSILTCLDDACRNSFMEKTVLKELKTHVSVDVVRVHRISCSLYQWCENLKEYVELPLRIFSSQDNEFTQTLNKDLKMTKQIFTTLMIQFICVRTTENYWYDQLDFMMKIMNVIKGTSQDEELQNQQCIINNTRLMAKLLQCLHDRLELYGRLKGDYSCKLYDILVDTITQMQIPTTAYKKCMDCIVLLLISDELYTLDIKRLVFMLEIKLCDLKWEIRDTTLEIINQIIIHLKVTNHSPSIITLCKSSWQSLSDGNSYVRASVITLIGTLSTRGDLFQKFLESTNIKKLDIVDKLVTVLKTDSEAFPRRSAVKTLQLLNKHCLLEDDLKTKIQEVMISTMNDFDWEVKIHVLDFWESIFVLGVSNIETNGSIQNGTVPSYTVELTRSSHKVDNTKQKAIESLLNSKFCEALLLGFNDYEQSVCEKATIIIKQFLTVVHDDIEFTTQNSLQCIKNLEDLDMESKLTTSDEYNRNPVSLLNDILATAGEQDEDNFVDCY
ncbi:hypothetical protein SNE40_019390 [Patella caerulea]|uniref:Uncharacterized protein n=1 Tax=Patella caerulea TaxID=87958 RepID=A0AAN8PIF3_PATCE